VVRVTPGLALSILAVALKRFSILDLMELLAQLVVEFRLRGDMESGEHIARAAKSHARFAVSPDAPSDNGDQDPGDNEAGA